MTARRAWLALLGLLFAVAASAQQMQVIELKYRLADDVIPVLRPLLEPGGVITGMDDKLFVKTGAANLRQIRDAVSALDRAPRQLLITVGQGSVDDGAAAGVRGSATVGNGDVQVGVNRPPGEGTGAQVEGRAHRWQTGMHDLSSVRTLEGTEAYVSLGQSVPVTSTTVSPGWPGPIVQQSTEYRDVTSGFYATPRVNGDRVTLEISSQQRKLRGQPGEVATRAANTTVSGRLGEWLPIGGVSETGSGNTRGVLVWGQQATADDYTVWVKVDEIP